MSSKTKRQWRTWLRTMGPLLVNGLIGFLALVIGSGALFFGYDKFLDVPDLVYTVLPSYELEAESGVLGLVRVENRGRATAHDVLIRVYVVRSQIEHYSVATEELYSLVEGGAGDAHLALWLERMASNSSLTIFVTTPPVGQVDGVTVLSEEVNGHPSSAQSLAVRLAPLVIAAILGGAVASAVWLRMNLRLRSEIDRLQKLVEIEEHLRELAELGVQEAEADQESGKPVRAPSSRNTS